MKITVKGKGTKTLNKRDFLASGGEGEVYARSGIAYKIYSDPKKMIPVGKIDELAEIQEPNIIKPLNIVMDTKNKPIGYTMTHIDKTYALCQLFTKSFRDREGLTPETVFDLVQKIQKGVKHIHSKDILLVDCNEMNFLVNKDFSEVYFIDVDSYQTPSFPATALMESVRDRHMKSGHFTQETDWFSWAIVTFQLFVGIHPYKGKHKSLKSLDDRMYKNISVFNPDVSVPKVVLPFDVIPQAYKDWYKAVFEKGLRQSPPDAAIISIKIVNKITKVMGTNKFDIKEIEDFSDLGDVVYVIHHYGTRIVQCKSGLAVNKKRHTNIKANTKIGFTPKMNHVVAATIDKGRLKLTNLSTGKEINNSIFADSIMTYDGRLYAVNEGSVYELEFVETPLKTLASAKLVANIMPQSSKMFDGVIVQNMLDACYVSVFPESGAHCQIRIKELENHKVIDAKFDYNVLMIVVADKDGKYNRFVFRFSEKYKEYDLRKEEDIVPSGLNFTVLETGNCAHINEDENLIVFRNKKDDDKATLVDDPAISSNMKLYRWGAQAVFSVGPKLYSIKMKN